MSKWYIIYTFSSKDDIQWLIVKSWDTFDWYAAWKHPTRTAVSSHLAIKSISNKINQWGCCQASLQLLGVLPNC